MSKQEIKRTVIETITICDECGKEITMVQTALLPHGFPDVELHTTCAYEILDTYLKAKRGPDEN